MGAVDIGTIASALVWAFCGSAAIALAVIVGRDKDTSAGVVFAWVAVFLLTFWGGLALAVYLSVR